MSAAKKVHGGLILAGGLLGVSLSLLILGASRGQDKDAGLPGSTAAPFTLRDTADAPHALAEWRGKSLVLVVAPRDDASFARSADETNQIVRTFAKDDAVSVVGVQVAVDANLLTDAVRRPGVLETQCPGLLTLQDPGGQVSSGYRTDRPTAFVVDDGGTIRARIPLDHDGAAVAVTDTVLALRPTNVRLPN